MTGLIGQALDEHRFSLSTFYARRVRRLFPAAYATLVITSVVSPTILDSGEYLDFVKQLAGSFAFAANWVLWEQSDYFSSAGELKPLLHMWSLAVEEQFYFLLPVLMIFTPKRFRLAFVIGGTVLSGVLCIYWVQRAPSLAFYMLPTRAWELGIGGAVALAVRASRVAPREMHGLRLIALAVIVLTPIVTEAGTHPGLPALLVCLATALLVVPGIREYSNPVVSVLSSIGDRSYSLYLVHWPLFAFANNLFVGKVPTGVNIAILSVCFVWAEVQFRLVEQKYRAATIGIRAALAFFVIAMLTSGGSLMLGAALAPDQSVAREPNTGLGRECAFDNVFVPRPECITQPKADLLVWGDSFAIHLVDGIKNSHSAGLIQATKTVCGPFLNIAPMDTGRKPERWAESCIAFNDSVVAYVRSNPQIRTVVLSSILIPYLQPEPDHDWTLLVRRDGKLFHEPQGAETLISGLRDSVDALHALGRTVVLFSPPPSSGVDMSRCLVRKKEERFTIPPGADCSFTLTEYNSARGKVRRFISLVRSEKVLPVVDFDEAICDARKCNSRVGDTALYVDHAHLSRAGSVDLARRMNWENWLRAAENK